MEINGNRYELGDDVKVTNPWHTSSSKYRNKIGKISSLPPKNSKVFIVNFNGTLIPLFYGEFVTVESEDTNYEEWVEETYNNKIFQKGDRVRISHILPGITRNPSDKWRLLFLNLTGIVVDCDYTFIIKFDYVPDEIRRNYSSEEIKDNTTEFSLEDSNYKFVLIDDEPEDTNYEQWNESWETYTKQNILEVGDNVIIGDKCPYRFLRGKTGRVVNINPQEPSEYGVQFDRFMSGDDCDGCGKKGYCFYISKRYLTYDDVEIGNFEEWLDEGLFSNIFGKKDQILYDYKMRIYKIIKYLIKTYDNYNLLDVLSMKGNEKGDMVEVCVKLEDSGMMRFAHHDDKKVPSFKKLITRLIQKLQEKLNTEIEYKIKHVSSDSMGLNNKYRLYLTIPYNEFEEDNYEQWIDESKIIKNFNNFLKYI